MVNTTPIILIDPLQAGMPISEQIASNGVEVSDSGNHRSYKSIWEVFKTYASECYELLAQEDLTECGEDKKSIRMRCGLCGKGLETTTCRIQLKEGFDPIVTRHPEMGIELEWPSSMSIGSTCVKMLGIDSYLTGFVNSLFVNHAHPSFKLDSHGYVNTMGVVVANYELWATDTIAVPHSYFSLIPQQDAIDAGIQICRLRNRFEPSKAKPKPRRSCYEKAFVRSINSTRGKWRSTNKNWSDYSVYSSEKDISYYASIITREQAKLLA